MSGEKPWYKSKTVWINALTLIVGVLTVLLNNEWIKENPDAVAFVGIAIAVVNVFLRWLTDQPITSVHKSFDFLRGRKKR